MTVNLASMGRKLPAQHADQIQISICSSHRLLVNLVSAHVDAWRDTNT